MPPGLNSSRDNELPHLLRKMLTCPNNQSGNFQTYMALERNHRKKGANHRDCEPKTRKETLYRFLERLDLDDCYRETRLAPGGENHATREKAQAANEARRRRFGGAAMERSTPDRAGHK